MEMTDIHNKEIIDTRDFADSLYDTRRSDVFEKIGGLYKKFEVDSHKGNSIRTVYLGLHDTDLM